MCCREKQNLELGQTDNTEKIPESQVLSGFLTLNLSTKSKVPATLFG